MFDIPGAIHPVLDGTHVPEHEAPDRRSVPRGEHGQCALPDASSSQVSPKLGKQKRSTGEVDQTLISVALLKGLLSSNKQCQYKGHTHYPQGAETSPCEQNDKRF